jgi:hypothetical protein
LLCVHTATEQEGGADAALTAEDVDRELVRLARGRGALDLAIGETLRQLEVGERLASLGYSRVVDYAREVLGLPARTSYFFVSLARLLAERSLLRSAVRAGLVSPRKALVVAAIAVEDAEVAWTIEAARSTEAALRRKVASAGREVPELAFDLETVRLRMTAAQQDRLARGIAFARMLLGLGVHEWQAVEALCQEALSSLGVGKEPEEGEEAAGGSLSESEREDLYRAWCAERAKDRGALERQIRAQAEAMAVCAGAEPDPELPPEAAAAVLQDRLRTLLAARHGYDEPFGRLAALAVRHRVWRSAGCYTLEEYSRERLGISPRTLRQRVWLEKRLGALPALREALRSGRLSFSKTLVVAKRATPQDVARRIEDAAGTTAKKAQAEERSEDERQNRAEGVREVWSPKDAAEMIALAIGAVMERYRDEGDKDQEDAEGEAGRGIDEGEALARIADHFVEVWMEEVRRRLARVSGERWEIFMEYGGICANPVCTRPATEIHHVVFRSRGGGEEAVNKLPLCTPCHQRAIHRGTILVTGKAGQRLIWILGRGELVPAEMWEVRGVDDVRRLGGEAADAQGAGSSRPARVPPAARGREERSGRRASAGGDRPSTEQ